MNISKRLIGFLLTGLLLVILCAGTNDYYTRENIRVALRFGDLADLPQDARNVHVGTQGGMFSRIFWLRFESTDPGISHWLKQSGGLVRKEWNTVGPKYIISAVDPLTGKVINSGTYPSPQRSRDQPEWFDPEVLSEVEYYELIIRDKSYYGELWVDRKHQRIYIKTSYS